MTKTTSGKTAPAKHKSALRAMVSPSAPTERETTEQALTDLAGWKAKHAEPTQPDRDVFAAKYSDAYCEAQGGQTRSRGVLKDSLAWLRILHGKPVGDAGISEVTYGLWIDWTTQLAVAVGAMDRGRSANTSSPVDEARTAARAAFRSVRDKVDEAIGRNEGWKYALAFHMDSERHGQLDVDAAKLQRIADALDGWFAGDDAVLKHSLATEGLTAASAKGCRDAAQALEAARSASVSTLGDGRDTPTVNLAEGRVLVLMQSVFKAVNNARSEKRTTLVLQPGAGTRHVIQPNGKRKAAEVPAEEGVTSTTSAPVKTKSKRRRGK